MRAVLGLISIVSAAVLLIAAYEQHRGRLTGNSEFAEASAVRIANSDGGEVLHVFKASREKEHIEQIETAFGLALLIAGIAFAASATLTGKCPCCGKHQNAAVAVCRFCGEDLAVRNP